MKTTQLSVFLENRVGTLAEVTRLLADENVNIRALLVADTARYGILRMIVEKPAEVQQLLRGHNILSTTSEVLAVCVDDRPGGLADVAKLLTDNSQQIEYMYAFLSRKDNKAYVVMRVENGDAAAALLEKAGYNGFDAE